jgi:hypothetical protein
MCLLVVAAKVHECIKALMVRPVLIGCKECYMQAPQSVSKSCCGLCAICMPSLLTKRAEFVLSTLPLATSSQNAPVNQCTDTSLVYCRKMNSRWQYQSQQHLKQCNGAFEGWSIPIAMQCIRSMCSNQSNTPSAEQQYLHGTFHR